MSALQKTCIKKVGFINSHRKVGSINSHRNAYNNYGFDVLSSFCFLSVHTVSSLSRIARYAPSRNCHSALETKSKIWQSELIEPT